MDLSYGYNRSFDPVINEFDLLSGTDVQWNVSYIKIPNVCEALYYTGRLSNDGIMELSVVMFANDTIINYGIEQLPVSKNIPKLSILLTNYPWPIQVTYPQFSIKVDFGIPVNFLSASQSPAFPNSTIYNFGMDNIGVLNISNDVINQLPKDEYTLYDIESAEVSLDFISYGLLNKAPVFIYPNGQGAIGEQVSLSLDLIFAGIFNYKSDELYYDPSISFLLKGQKVNNDENNDGSSGGDGGDDTTMIILVTIFCSLFGFVVLGAVIATIIFILYKKKMLTPDTF
eukprot:TRINITY_DN10288_c0_g1_i2.p1 TRINITY_DN10288_c0_g1~~TRINITY_DN10288_c0_g1_i2.p1  ORF type:complete len:285 (-),score=41.17 TRINITY_DN10288_c0_g1_i2:128-982(-)